jgi:hypothetical protein
MSVLSERVTTASLDVMVGVLGNAVELAARGPWSNLGEAGVQLIGHVIKWAYN